VYLQTSTTLSPNIVIKNLFSYLYQNLSEKELSSILEIPITKLELSRKEGLLDFDTFAKLKEKCGFSYANLYHKGLDHDCILARLTQQSLPIPKRYTTCAYSSRMNSHNILLNLSPEIREDAINFLQIEGHYFYSPQNITNKISTIINSDLLKYLVECHLFQPQDIYKLGQMSGFYNLNLPFGYSFKGLSLKESFEKVTDEIVKHFETSFKYELISLTHNKAIIRKHFSEKMKEQLNQKTYSNQYLCKYIEGSFSAIALYTTRRFVRTSQERCAFSGDSYSEFHIYLDELSG